MTNAGAAPLWSEATQAELDRFGFSDPYDPRFIHTAIFGTKMSGHAMRWPDIDFDVLAKVNPDVVGWIHMQGSPVDYPVVANHLDANHYAFHNFSGEESLHGQVALAFGCGRRMGGRNTVLSAHNMRDWSMFRAVRALCDRTYADEHPTVDLMAADGRRWQGRWFAATRYHSDDPWPARTRFADDGDFAWLEQVLAQYRLDTDVLPNAHTPVLTCCTCAMTPGSYGMRAVFAVLEEASCDRP